MPECKRIHFPSRFLLETQMDRVDRYHRSRPFSIYWETRFLLYLGVLVLSGGLGGLVYSHIDAIGRQAILACMALATLGCLGVCAWKGAAFTTGKPAAASPGLDYLLLLGALLFGIFIGYAQSEYAVFGSHYGLALGLPATFYLFLAYRFDHRGVLQLGISGLAAAFGILVTPLSVLESGLLYRNLPIAAGLVMAAVLLLAATISWALDCKRHFAFSYVNIGMHLGMISAFAGMVSGNGLEKAAYGALMLASAFALWKYAQKVRSHYFLLCAVLYGYVGFTYAVIRWIPSAASVWFLYFLLSCAGAIGFFLNMKSFLGKTDAGVLEK